MEFKKEKNWTDLEKLREKLRYLEDQSHQCNIQIDGLDKYENERWVETEELLIETFSINLGLENVKIEKKCRVGDPKVSTKRRTVSKLASYKDKRKVLSKCNRLKGTGIYINKDFSKETIEIRKQNWDRVKALREQSKCIVLVYDRIYAR